MNLDIFNERFFEELAPTGLDGEDFGNIEHAKEVVAEAKEWIDPRLTKDQVGVEIVGPKTVIVIGNRSFSVVSLFFHVISSDLLLILEAFGKDHLIEVIKKFSEHQMAGEYGIGKTLETLAELTGNSKGMIIATHIRDFIDNFFGRNIQYMNNDNFQVAVDLLIFVLRFGDSYTSTREP